MVKANHALSNSALVYVKMVNSKTSFNQSEIILVRIVARDVLTIRYDTNSDYVTVPAIKNSFGKENFCLKWVKSEFHSKSGLKEFPTFNNI